MFEHIQGTLEVLFPPVWERYFAPTLHPKSKVWSKGTKGPTKENAGDAGCKDLVEASYLNANMSGAT